MPGRIFQLNASPGGVPKLALREAEVTELGLVGDDHLFPDIHGGPDRALCLFSLEHILKFQSEGHPIFPGSAGENITVSGLDWQQLAPGARLALGDQVLIEITRFTSPCNSMEPSFLDRNYGRLSQKANPGYSRVYARVLQQGKIIVGQKVRIIEGPSDG
ncbi:MAG TPA: MOSC domain-containing protein [Pyrinomonadaceae bacterium]|nr:MOSC domain-containing protein [Pyrinomonadaceae bacterium]